MDKLKEYLLRHKAELDVDSPAPDTWEHIAARPGSSSWMVRVAAAACVIALVGGGLWLIIRNNRAPSDTADTAKQNGGAVKSEPAPGKEKVGDSVRNEGSTARNPSKPKQAHHKTRSRGPAGSSDEVDLIDKSYSSLIDNQLKKLRATPLYAENGSYFSFYVDQFKQMDHDEQAVRNDIKTYGLTTEFLEQLINVYQQKLNVLKNLQTEINKMNNKVREKQARSATPEVHYLDI
jgi:hypothetical protein